jgi:flagellar hook-associated protein 2
MASVQLPGLFSGIDTNTLISQLMQAEQGTLNQYQTQKQTWTDKQTALDALKTKLTTLKSSVAALSNADDLRTFTTTCSNTDVLTAEASTSAVEGNHTIVVNQLANPERWVHTAGKEYAEDSVGAGTFIYSYNGQETTITTTADTTLQDMVGLINNDANNPGVTASLLNYGQVYHLVLNGNGAGSDYAISINSSNTEVWQAASAFTTAGGSADLTNKIVDLGQFNGTLAGGESITISGKRHNGTAVSQNVSINKATTLNQLVQEINGAFGGTAKATLVNGQLRLADTTNGQSQMELSLTYNPGSGSTSLAIPAIAESVQGGSVTAGLAGFTATDFTKTQSAQDSQIKVDGYPSGDANWLSRSSNTIDDVITGVTLHLHATGTSQVDLTRDTQSIKTKLSSVVSTYNAAVSLYADDTKYDTSTKKAGVLMGDSVVSDIADNLRLPLLQVAKGFVTNLDSVITPGQIGLALDKDGKLSLDTSTFDTAVANGYMSVLDLIGANKTGSSDSNTIQFYSASSNYTMAGTYDVQVKIEGGIITSAKIKGADETDYRDATIRGDTIIGNSTFDKNGNPVYSENGLQLSVDRRQDGTFTATVQVKQGFAGAMTDALSRMLDDTTGAVSLDRQGMQDQIDHLGDRITTEQDRLTKEQSALVTKFANLEKTLVLLQNQMAGLGISTSTSGK